MNRPKKRRFDNHTSTGLIALALASVAILGARDGWSQNSGAPKREGLRYICVGSIAVDLWPADESAPLERHPEMPMAEAKRRCRPPMPPSSKRSKTVAAAVAPASGFGAVLEEWNAGPDAALTGARELLEAAGWVETAGSKLLRSERPDLAAAAYENDGAWLFTLEVPRPGASRTLILTAGLWPDLKESAK
jgi:hypothetical protein